MAGISFFYILVVLVSLVGKGGGYVSNCPDFAPSGLRPVYGRFVWWAVIGRVGRHGSEHLRLVQTEKLRALSSPWSLDPLGSST